MSLKKQKLKVCGYSECGQKFMPLRPMQAVCSPACAVKFNEEKEVKKRVKQMENNVTTYEMLKKAARDIFQKWVRLRDENLPCISCGTTYTAQWQGGHYMKAELFSGVIFDEMNVNKQCAECNGENMHGNVTMYRIGLVKKYGEKAVQELEVLAIEKKQYKWSREELIDIANKYKARIKNGDFT